MATKILGVGAAAVALIAPASMSAEVTYTVSRTNGLQAASASFTFDDVTNQLCIELTNTMTENPDNGTARWLTGLFFNMSGATVDAYDMLGAGTGDVYTFPDGTYANKVVEAYNADQFWAYRGDMTGDLPFGDMNYGLGAAGFGEGDFDDVFTNGDMLAGGGPDPQPNGVDGGIVADFAGLEIPQKSTEFVLGTIIFKFDLASLDMNNVGVSDVAFAFGSSFSEIVLIPLPSGAAMATAGMGLLVLRRRRTD